MERSLLKLLEEKSLEEYKALQGEWKPDFHSNKEKIYICRQPRFVDVPIHTHEEIYTTHGTAVYLYLHPCRKPGKERIGNHRQDCCRSSHRFSCQR